MARYVHPHFQRNANELREWSYDDAKAKYATAGVSRAPPCRPRSTSIRRARAEAGEWFLADLSSLVRLIILDPLGVSPTC